MKTIEHVQAVIFDLDGTLCDSLPDLAAAANAMRREHGMTALPAAQIESYVGDGIAALVHRALSGAKDGKVEQNQWEQGFTGFIRYYAEHIADHTRTYPEVKAGLGLLKTLGIPLAVVTNKNEILATKLLHALGIADYFSMVLGGDSLPAKKPDPLPLLHIAEVLGIPPQNMLMVGDSHNDILAAKAAGCLSVGVTYGYGDMTLLSQHADTKPDWIIRTLPEIYEHLRPQKPQNDS